MLPILLATALLALPQGWGNDKHDKHGKHEKHGKQDREDRDERRDQGLPPGLAKKGGVPPGLAKKGGLPPGLAKKFGHRVPERPYIAVDPRYRDRAYFLIDGRWELRKGLEAHVQAELQDVLRLPRVAPPIPLPKIGADLHVVLFGN
jgi:hypothetical protein